jgi:TPR repeat protein
MNNNNKKQRLHNELESMSSQQIHDILTKLDRTEMLYVDPKFIDTLKLKSEEQILTGDSLAINNLGFIFLREENYSEAEKLFLKSAGLGNPIAMYNLGCLYSYDEYKEYKHNKRFARDWYSSAASYGYVDAMYCLGSLYEEEHNYRLAESWYTSAAELGDVDSMEALVEIYDLMKDKWMTILNTR